MCKHHLIIYDCLKSTLKTKEEYIYIYIYFFFDNSKFYLTKLLETYFHGTMNVPSSIQRWLFPNGLPSVGQHFCGGTILDTFTILSAAHCFDDYGDSVEGFYIRAGSRKWSSGGQVC